MLKSDSKKIFVEHEDLITAMTRAKKEKNELILSELMDLFINFDSTNEEGYLEINNNSSVAIFIKNTKGIFNEQSFINPSILAFALSRAIYEYNYEMKKIIQKYLVALMDAKINKEDPEVIINLIYDDEKVTNYIKKFATLDDYINKKEKHKKIEKKETQKINSRSHVIM